MTEPSGLSWRITCLGATAAGGAALAGAVSSIVPAASVEVVDFRATDGAPEADLFVIDATWDGDLAIEQLRILRARGAPAPAIVVGNATLAVPASLGEARLADPAQLATALPNALEAVARARDAAAREPGVAGLAAAVAEVRQLIAAGQIARRVKHDLNNPLAALLAEAQLLELEDLDDEAREAVARIVELARRVIDEARRLDGPRGTPVT